ncbi:MAG: tetratricopeptide repeat protein [Acidobacteriota bacterium]
MTRIAAPALALVMIGLAARPAAANRESETLRARAAAANYSLDHDAALAAFRQAVAADPDDAAAHRGLASALWLSITYRRGNMTVDDYLGRVNRTSTPPPPPPAETAAAFRDAIDRALALARKRVGANPRDADGHYQIGAAVGLRASYIATVEGRALGAFRAAREAYEEHEKVLELDPGRKDAGLTVGTYRYIVSVLALPVRWVAYMAGFGGGKDRGLRMVEEAAAYPGDNQTDARFALILIYNRERRYDDALKQLEVLRRQFPRNRLVWVESGATSLRAGRAADAERFLSDGLARFGDDDRPRMFGETALWLYKRGAARVALGRSADAEQDLQQAVSLEGRPWVHGRAHLELGRLMLKAGNRSAARQAFQTAATLCDSDNDGATADEARRLLK